ncbi:hypothetical protein ACFQX9_29820 [Bradyrhizobium sp. GCM10028915]|uniref:hypothetical protein n=1 Tax=Bradyrhizobium sp. GCM10028915 TaxID=3273385 RepID=UPI003609D0B1
MAGSPRKGMKLYDVRAIYAFFKILENSQTSEGKNKLELFLADCDKNGNKMGVDRALFDLGHDHFSSPTDIDAVGPDCPLCPSPGRS